MSIDNARTRLIIENCLEEDGSKQDQATKIVEALRKEKIYLITHANFLNLLKNIVKISSQAIEEGLEDQTIEEYAVK